MLSPADILALTIMKLKGFFHRVNFSGNSRFTISLVSVHRKLTGRKCTVEQKYTKSKFVWYNV